MNKDCKGYMKYYCDTIKMIGLFGYKSNKTGDTIILRKDVRGDTSTICTDLRIDFKGNSDSIYNDYIKHYDVVVFTKKEFTDTATIRLVDNTWKEKGGLLKFILRETERTPKYYTDNDYLVFGGINIGNERERPQGRISWYFYVLRKTHVGWKIFACPSK